MGKHQEEIKFRNPKAVFEFLEPHYKVSVMTVYNHVKTGKLQKAGEFFAYDDVIEYAEKNLPKKAGSAPGEGDDLQTRKLRAEIRKIEEQAERIAFQRAVEQGRFVPRATLELEIAARAGVFEAGLKHEFTAAAPELVALVRGDIDRSADLVESLKNKIDSFLNEYANTRRFEVIFTDDTPAA